MNDPAEQTKHRELVSLDDLRNCGWQAISRTPATTYEGAARELREEASRAVAGGHNQRANALELLASICLLGMDPANKRQPFQPFIVLEGRRSFLPEDLDTGELTAVSDFSAEIALPLLAARLADVAWVNVRPRKIDLARVAIDCYCFDSPAAEAWFHGGRERWNRALWLCHEIGKAAEGRLQSLEARLLVVLEEPSSAGFLCSVAELLYENRLGASKRNKIAERLEKEASSHLARQDALTARELLLEAAKWYRKSNRAEDASRATATAADTWIAEARLNEANATSGYLMAGSRYEAAIRLLRTIPRAHRLALLVDDKIRESRQRITECIERGAEDLPLFEFEGVDISEMVETSRRAVSGQSLLDALRTFVRIVRPVLPEVWHKQAVESAREYPLQTLFGASHLSNDGRLIARTPGLSLGDQTSPEWKSVIHHRAAQTAALHMGLCVKGGILPALEIINADHRLLERDLVALAAKSPSVPEGRELMVGRGLCAGFRQDFAVAVHLLTPQLEHFARCALRSVGVQTRHMDDHGIEMEVGLSTLMEMPEAERVFAPLAFEMRILFCDAAGYNLRNDLAHGLLDDSHMFTEATVYAWWFCLRLFLWPLLDRLSAMQPEPPTESST